MILESLFIYSFNKAKQSRTREELNTDTEDEDQEEAGTSNIIQPGGQLPSKEKKVSYVILHLNSIKVLPISLSLLKVR